jgi:Zinc knuckle
MSTPVANSGSGASVSNSSTSAQSGGGQTGRNPGSYRGNHRNPKYAPGGTPTAFKGHLDAMNGQIYDVPTSGKADQFNATTKVLVIVIGSSVLFKDCAGAICTAINNKAAYLVPLPPALSANVDLEDVKIRDLECLEVVKERRAYGKGNVSLFSLVLGQCTEAMTEKIMAMTESDAIFKAFDGVKLLNLMRGIVYNQESSVKFVGVSAHENMLAALSLTQDKSHKDTVQKYHTRFLAAVEVAEQSGGTFIVPCIEKFIIAGLNLDTNPAKWTTTDKATIRTDSRELYLAVIFLRNADPGRFGELQLDTENDFTRGSDTYPRTVGRVYEIMNNYIVKKSHGYRGGDSVSFAHYGEDGVALNQNAAHITCHNCKKKGHYASACPVRDVPGTGAAAVEPKPTLATVAAASAKDTKGISNAVTLYNANVECALNFLNDDGSVVPDSWLLLDNASTVDVISNKSLLANIRESSGSMTIHCNAGSVVMTMIGDLPGYGTVWYHPDGIANILSLSRAISKGHVVYDSKKGNEFVLIKAGGSKTVFKQSEQGLYYVDTAKEGSVFIYTVADNQFKYTSRELIRADAARRLQQIIGRPSTRDLINIVNKNLLPNCTVTAADIMAADEVSAPFTDVPSSILERYRDVKLSANIMKVNGVSFLVSISEHIKFGTAAMVESHHAKVLLKALAQIKQTYAKRGFRVVTILIYGEFESERAALADLGIALNTASQDEHVPEIERRIRTIKERVRGVWNTLPFKKVPCRMIIEMVYASNFWLNVFPASTASRTPSALERSLMVHESTSPATVNSSLVNTCRCTMSTRMTCGLAQPVPLRCAQLETTKAASIFTRWRLASVLTAVIGLNCPCQLRPSTAFISSPVVTKLPKVDC